MAAFIILQEKTRGNLIQKFFPTKIFEPPPSLPFYLVVGGQREHCPSWATFTAMRTKDHERMEI
jgi:hypothetical protein